MSDSSPVSPDQPELRLLAQLAGLKPSALAAALNNPEHFSKHISADELSRYLASAIRTSELIVRINDILQAELKRTLKARPELERLLRAKGIKTRA